MSNSNKSTYRRKLADPRWQKRRLEVFHRCGWKCSACGTKSEELHIHHRYYISGREPWKYGDFALVALCHECHSDERTEPNNLASWENILTLLFGGPGAEHWAELFEGAIIDLCSSAEIKTNLTRDDVMSELYRRIGQMVHELCTSGFDQIYDEEVVK